MPPRIQRYNLRHRIGVGGMAEVWLADATFRDGTEHAVVVKKILGHLSEDPAYQAMFLDEARIAASLKHRNIVEMLDRGRMDEALFLALEYVDGVDVGGMLRAGQAIHQTPSLQAALWITSEVLAGLEYVHDLRDAAGIPMQLVHRDVGLGNVLLAKSGDVKLTDFGIAKSRDRISRTTAGVIKGNALSMAPEQISSGTVDARTDLYATGMLLHALLIGRHPLERFPISRIFQIHVEGRLPLPSSENPTVHPDLDGIVAMATALAPRDRYPGAGAMRRAILAFAGREGIALRPNELAKELSELAAGAPPPAEKTVVDPDLGSNLMDPRVEPSVVARLGPLISDAIGDSADAGEHTFHTEQSVSGEHPAVAASAPADEPSIRARLATLAQSRPRLPAFDDDEDVDTGLGPTASATGSFDGAGWSSEDAEAETGVSEIPGEVLDDDAATTTEALVRDPQMPERTNQVDERDLPRPGTRERVVALSAKFRSRLVGHRLAVTAVTGAADRDVLATASSDGNVVIWDVEGCVPLRTLRGHTAPATTLSITRDATRLLSGARDGTLRLWDPATGENVRTLRGHGRWISAAQIAPDGTGAVSVGDDRTLRVWSLDSDAPERTVQNAHGDFVSAVSLVPGTGFVVTGSFDRTLKLWDLRDGSEIRTMRGMERVRTLAVDPSGLHALAGLANGSIALWDLANGEDLAHINAHQDAVTSLEFVTDRIAISAGFDGMVRLWEIPARRELIALDPREREPVLAATVAQGHIYAACGTALLIWDLAGLHGS
ncbi:MAG TPA: protein kinase [bacterium]|nr:protein kinase [bacterium]